MLGAVCVFSSVTGIICEGDLARDRLRRGSRENQDSLLEMADPSSLPLVVQVEAEFPAAAAGFTKSEGDLAIASRSFEDRLIRFDSA